VAGRDIFGLVELVEVDLFGVRQGSNLMRIGGGGWTEFSHFLIAAAASAPLRNRAGRVSGSGAAGSHSKRAPFRDSDRGV
jgi:hypothetical protein